MNLRALSRCLLAAFGLPIIALAQPPAQPSIQVLATFDYPGTGNSTTPFGINQRNDISGRFVDANGVTRGFVRFRDGNFTAPIAEPNDNGNFTEVGDLNTSRTVAGDFVGAADGNSHGFLFSHGTFTQFDLAGALSTFIIGINDAGDFVGGFTTDTQPEAAFFDIAGATTTLAIDGAINTQAVRINGNDQAVGQYTDSASVDHGFFRAADGTVTFPIDFPAPGSTNLNGINDQGLIVGRYTDDLGVNHGFVLRLPDSFFEYDFPGASGTSFNGINDQGFIAGRYADDAGVRHGFVARFTPIGGGGGAMEIRPSEHASSSKTNHPTAPEPPG